MKTSYEYIIIGSGFGGAMTAFTLASAGKEVLIIEKGKWVTRDDSCWDEMRLHIKDPLYRSEIPFLVNQKKGRTEKAFTDDTVGGMSTMYGAVSLRMREDDFNGAPLPGTDGRSLETAWPWKYSEISPFYTKAEQLLGIAGIRGCDITEPPVEKDYLHEPLTRLSGPSGKIYGAAESLGLHPFFLPMAINFSGRYGKNKCVPCATCDHYCCKIEAKNDLSVTVIPRAMKAGAELLDETIAVKINCQAGKAASVETISLKNGEKKTIRAGAVIVSCGALASPHLIISSGLHNELTGRYLFRHANGVVAGIFPYQTNPEQTLQKQIAIPDFYHGIENEKPAGPWGMLQDVSGIGREVVRHNSPPGLKNIAAFLSPRLINIMCMAEDIPQYSNRVFADPSVTDRFGMPGLRVYHRYAARDILARNKLYTQAKKILRKSGALFFYTMPFNTFSHAMGTCRMGTNESASVIDETCALRGVKNIYVIDASAMPSGGAVNPSLTIAALSLKAAEGILSRKA